MDGIGFYLLIAVIVIYVNFWFAQYLIRYGIDYYFKKLKSFDSSKKAKEAKAKETKETKED